MARIVVSRLLEHFELSPCFAAMQPSRKQMGGVSRPESAARVAYRLRAPAP
jgi:hypothetical protein